MLNFRITKSMLGAIVSAGVLAIPMMASADPVIDAIPAKYKEAGVLKVGEVFPFVPYIWRDEKTNELTGFEVDVGNAIGKRMGLKWDITETKWEGLITGVGASRYDVGGAGANDRVERHAVVTFISFNIDSIAVVVLDKNKEKFATVDSLCGQSVGTLKGTSNATLTQELSDECVAKNLPPMKINLYTQIPDADLAMRSGRDVAQTVQSAQARWAIKSGEPWTVIKDGYSPAATGFYVSAKNPELANAILLATKDLYATGELQKIMGKYGLEPNVIEPVLNYSAKK